MLQFRNPGGAPGQAQADPRVEVLSQDLAGGTQWQDAPFRVVELVNERWRDIDDRRHPVGPGELPPRGPPIRVQLLVEVPRRAADTDAEHPREGGREYHIGCRPRWRELAGQHGRPVLAEVLAVEAAVQAVGQERMIDAAMDQRHTVQAYVRGVGDHAGQR